MKFARICLVTLAFTLTACQSSETNQNAAKPTANTNASVPASTSVSANKPNLSTPAQTALAFYQGVKNKDIEKVKSTLSKETLAVAEKQSHDSGKAIMETIEQSAPPPESQPDIGKETINGNTATLQVSGLDSKKKDQVETFYFVKEGEDWKLDLFHETKKEEKEEKAAPAKQDTVPKAQ